MEGSQVPRVQKKNWKRARWQVVYVGGNKLLPGSKGWKVKMIWFPHNIYGGSMDRGNDVTMLTRREIEQTNTELRNTAVLDTSGILNVRVGGNQYQSETLAPLQY